MAQSFRERMGDTNYAKYEEMLRDSSLSSTDIVRRCQAEFGVPISSRRVREHRNEYTDAASQDEAVNIDAQEDATFVETYSQTVRTVEDALRKAEIDGSEWEVERSLINHWEMGAKLDNGRIAVTPLWQVKLWLKKRVGWGREEFRQMLADDINSFECNIARPAVFVPPTKLLAELSIFDAHFGKLAWKPEAGDNYDIHIAESRYMAAANDLLARAEAKGVDKVLYVVGNDYFHSDHKYSTTGGTPLDCDGRWQKAFRVGVKCAIETIQTALSFAPVDVLVVPGNHDEEKAFVLGELLAAKYENVSAVAVLNQPTWYHYYRYGTCLLMFCHGDEQVSQKKRDALPHTMAQDRPQDWSETTCREIHMGHIHHEREDTWRFRSAEAIRDVVVRSLPSISSTDAWHRHSNYRSILAAEMHYYHYDHGRYGYEVFPINMEVDA